MSNPWVYEKAFSRNLGLVNSSEQQILRNSRVAIPGMGGVGGIHAITLARLGVGKFIIADPDTYEVANFNRQFGATVSSIGRAKVDVMTEWIKQINPEAEVRALKEAVTAENVSQFMEGADMLVDGFDAYVIDARREAFKEARRRGIYGVTAGPFGFGTGWIVFDPNGMSFEEYFDFKPHMSEPEKVSAFMVGMVPRSLHIAYQDTKTFNMKTHTGPSSSMGCAISSGVVGVETVKVLLKRPGILAAPYFSQFDAYRGLLARKKLSGGNRHPMQLLKRTLFTDYITRSTSDAPPKGLKGRAIRWMTNVLMREK